MCRSTRRVQRESWQARRAGALPAVHRRDVSLHRAHHCHYGDGSGTSLRVAVKIMAALCADNRLPLAANVAIRSKLCAAVHHAWPARARLRVDVLRGRAAGLLRWAEVGGRHHQEIRETNHNPLLPATFPGGIDISGRT